MADSKYAHLNRSKNGDLYRVTAGCPCDDCDIRQDCETECKKFSMWAKGPSWRKIAKAKEEIQ